MKDLNFFSVYAKKKSASSQRLVLPILITVLAALLVAGSYIGLSRYQRGIDAETAKIDTYLKSDEVKSKLDAIATYNLKEQLLDQYGQMIDEVLKNLAATDYMNSARMDKISAALPAGVAMKSFSIQENTAVFEFYVADVATAARLAAALSGLDLFQSVALTEIDGSPEQGTAYSATVNAVLKGGDAE